MLSPRAYFAAVCFVLLTGCSRKPESSPAVSPDSPVAYSPNGWSGAERAEYYHLAEGSELMPYTLLANLKSSKTGKPFLEGMERFGFLPDAKSSTNPYGMPVGMTVVRSRNASARGVEMVGFSCAACHVGELTYHGKRVRIDGAPGLIDLEAYQVEFQESLDATMKDPPALLALVVAMDQKENMADSPSAEGVGQYAADAALQGADDVKPVPNADPSFHSVSSQAADAARPAAPQPGFRERMKTSVAFLKARLAHIRNGKLLLDGTEPGPGRIDAFGAARNLLFPKSAMKMQSPVSFPFLWGVPDTTQQRDANQEPRWIHYDGNTNSILERNIGQALGMGAVFDPQDYESTLRIGNLHRLEVLTHKLQPPAWPSDVLGPIDQAKAQKGEAIFKDKCEGCHQDKLCALAEVMTDPMRANSFGQPVGGKPFPAAVAPILAGLKKRAFQDDGISEADQAGMDANPVVWRATGQYKARKLNGIWATAPYLHNGSVPTLYHMLHPDERPARFFVGNREYDAAKAAGSTTPPSQATATSATEERSSALPWQRTRKPSYWNI
ncbi:MAG: di-heme-cytochrome C peroxidase [Bryobacteraceae bacterium]